MFEYDLQTGGRMRGCLLYWMGYLRIYGNVVLATRLFDMETLDMSAKSTLGTITSKIFPYLFCVGPRSPQVGDMCMNEDHEDLVGRDFLLFAGRT